MGRNICVRDEEQSVGVKQFLLGLKMLLNMSVRLNIERASEKN